MSSISNKLIWAVAFWPLSLFAQESAEGEAPLSAIDWLNQIPAEEGIGASLPLLLESPTVESAATPTVEATPLGEDDGPGLGLLSAAASGLPNTLWRGADIAQMAQALEALPDEALAPVAALRTRMLLTAARAPDGADPRDFLLFRAEALRTLGYGNEALALLTVTEEFTPALFASYADLALITSTEDRACARLRAEPWLSEDAALGVFCLARAGDWNAAALALQASRVLGDVEADLATLLEQFLEPELAEGTPPQIGAADITPLVVRLREAIGAPIATQDLPRIYAQGDLRTEMGWKAQLDAAERLARTGAIGANQLFGLYTANRPAASGGVWDRAAAVQALDAALSSGDDGEISQALPQAFEAMVAARLAPLLAEITAPRLDPLAELDGSAAKARDALLLLSDRYEEVGPSALPFLSAVARGEVAPATPRGAMEAAIKEGFIAAPPAPAQGALGLTMLDALAQIESARQGDLSGLSQALANLRALGLESTARRAALHLLIAG
ncbi:MAG: hypothetical protein AAF618_13155 [Pseudomonadota bacterium]